LFSPKPLDEKDIISDKGIRYIYIHTDIYIYTYNHTYLHFANRLEMYYAILGGNVCVRVRVRVRMRVRVRVRVRVCVRVRVRVRVCAFFFLNDEGFVCVRQTERGKRSLSLSRILHFLCLCQTEIDIS